MHDIISQLKSQFPEDTMKIIAFLFNLLLYHVPMKSIRSLVENIYLARTIKEISARSMSAMLRRVGTEQKVQQEIFTRLMRRNEIVSYDTSGLILIFRDYEDGGIQAQQYEMFIAYKGGSACINPVPGSIAYMDTLRET